jgi:hypothetical protein
VSSYDAIWARMPDPDVVISESRTFWRQELPIWEPAPRPDDPPKIIVGGMWSPQQLWWNLPQEQWIRVFVGGYGSGKTNILLKRMVALALINAPAPTAITSPNYTMSRQVLLEAIRTLLEGRRHLSRGAFQYKINLSKPMSVELFYKGRHGIIHLLSADNPDHLKGTNLAAAGMDEPFIQDYEVFTQLVARCRDPRAVRSELVIAGTPEGVSNWGQSLCEGKIKEQFKGAVGVVRASTMDNLATGHRYVNKMIDTYTDERVRQAYLEGQFVNLSNGRVYYGFEKSSNVIEVAPPQGARFGIGMDFNVNPMAFCVFWYTTDHIHYLKEYELPNADTEYACQLLREEWPSELIATFPDASGKSRATNAPGGKSDFSILQQHGFRVYAHSSNPTRRDRYNASNKMLSPGFGGKVGVTISPTGCKQLMVYLDQYTHEHMNKQEAMSHLLDAFSYPIAYLFPLVRPTIQLSSNFQ